MLFPYSLTKDGAKIKGVVFLQQITQKRLSEVKNHQPKGGLDLLRKLCEDRFDAGVREVLVTTMWPKTIPFSLIQTEENLRSAWGKDMFRYGKDDCESALEIVEYVLGLRGPG